MHNFNVSQATVEEEFAFNFMDCPDVEKQELFSAKYDAAQDVQNLERLIHSRDIAKVCASNRNEVSQDMFDYLKNNKRGESQKNVKTQCKVCKTGNMCGKGFVQHLKSKSHNLLTNLKHKNCSICLQNLWSAGFLTQDDLKKSHMFRDLQDMISAKNKDIFGRNYHLTRSDGFLENLILGLLLQTNLNTTIESLCLDVKMNDSAMLEMFDVFR